MTNALAALAATFDDGEAFLRAVAGPFRRALRVHPRRGAPQGWGELTPVPWNPHGFFTRDDADPGDFLDHHTGAIYPQDAASQVPVLLLAPQPGENLVDACAAPGSKATQIGLALGDDGLLVCCDVSPPRRRVLAENLGRQGVSCALVTPMPLDTLAERHPASADGVLVDAPCSGHEPRSAKQVAVMAGRQMSLLHSAARLVRSGGRMVYSTCTPYREENEGVVERFLAAHPQWEVERVALAGCDPDLAGLGAVRLWPQRHATEPFFACRLRLREAPRDALHPHGVLPPSASELGRWLPTSALHCWRRGNTVLAATAQAAACALPSEARGILLGHGEGESFRLEPWAAQALIERGADSSPIDHLTAIGLWAGEDLVLALSAGALVRTHGGAPLGQLGSDGRRLLLPSRLRRAQLR